MINVKNENMKECNDINDSYKNECSNNSYENISSIVNETINMKNNLNINVSINGTVTNKANEANINKAINGTITMKVSVTKC